MSNPYDVLMDLSADDDQQPAAVDDDTMMGMIDDDIDWDAEEQ